MGLGFSILFRKYLDKPFLPVIGSITYISVLDANRVAVPTVASFAFQPMCLSKY